jgi:hypothetical protein
VIVQTKPTNFNACEKENWNDNENEVYDQYVHPDPYYSLFAI